MEMTASRRGINVLLRWGLITRLFCACLVDGWALMNAGWISVLMASALTLPAATMMWLMHRDGAHIAPRALLDGALGPPARRALCLLLCVASLYEAAIGSRYVTLSASFSAFDQAPDWLMILITLGLVGIACLTGAGGVSGAAQLLRWLVIFFAVATWIAMIPYMNFRWLTPILGPGLPVLWRGALSMAGMETVLIAAWLCMAEETGQSREGGRPYRPTGAAYMLRTLAMLTMVAVVAILLVCLIAPASPGAPTERDYALERYLSNGRVPIALQFPLVFLWFMTQILMVALSLFCAGAMLSQAVPKMPPRLCTALCTAASVAVALSPAASRTAIDRINLWRYLALTAALLPFAAAHLIKRRRTKHAQA